MNAFDSDQPCTNPDEDAFNRRGFAERVAHIIARHSDSSSLVVSINGAWGDGKSSVLAFAKHAIQREGAATVDFNPWRYPGEDALLIAFFHKLAEAIDVQILKGGEIFRKLVEKRLPWFGNVAGSTVSKTFTDWTIPPAITLIGKGIVSSIWAALSPKIEELRKRIHDELLKQKKRVVVMVDDPDRLDAQDLFALFRLIKLTADFPYTTFLLAMDHEAVAEALGTRFPSGEKSAGESFIEKIVQVPLRLPVIPPLRLIEFARKCIFEVVEQTSSKISKQDIQRFNEVFTSLLAPRVRTPRLAKRYANTVRFALGLLPGEVNCVDVILLEGIRLFWPSLFQALARSERLLFDIQETYLDTLESSEASDRLSKFFKLIDAISPQDEEHLTRHLPSLLPQLISTRYLEFTEMKSWDREKRICSRYYFWRFFSAAIYLDDVPDAAIDAIIKHVENGNVIEAGETIQNGLDGRLGVLYTYKLRLASELLNSASAATMAIAISQVADHFPDGPGIYFYDYPFGTAAIIAAECVMRQNDEGAQNDLALKLIDSALSVQWAVRFYYALPRNRPPDGQASEPEKRLSGAQTNAIGKGLAVRLHRRLQEVGIGGLGESAGQAIWHLQQFGFVEFLREWISATCKTSHEFALQIIGYQMGLRSDSTSTKYIWEGAKTFNRVLELVDLPEFFKVLKAHLEGKEENKVMRIGEEVTLEQAGFLFLAMADTSENAL